MAALFLGLGKSQSITLGLVLCVAAVYYIYKLRRRIVLSDQNGVVKLRPNLIVGIIGLLCCLSYLAFVLFTIYSARHGFNRMGVGPNFILCFVFAPIFVFGYFHLRIFLFHRLEFDQLALSISDMYGKKTKIDWTYLKWFDGSFSLLPFQSYVLRTDLYDYKIDVNMVGFKVFEEYLKEHNPDVSELLQWKLYHRPYESF